MCIRDSLVLERTVRLHLDPREVPGMEHVEALSLIHICERLVRAVDPGTMSTSGRSGAAAAIREWRVFLGPRYRRFQGIGGSGAVVAALAGDGLTLSLIHI